MIESIGKFKLGENMKDQDIMALVMQMNSKGIQLSARYEPIGCSFTLKPSDVASFIKDRDGFFANECGLSREEYREWKKYMIEGRLCGAPTKSGTCKRPAKNSATLSPQEYHARKNDGTLMCGQHIQVPYNKKK